MCSKYVFKIEKRPPAKVGVLIFSKADTKGLDSSMIQVVLGEPNMTLLYRVGFIFAQLLCILRNLFPAETQAPVEVASVGSTVGGRRLVEAKGVEVNSGNFWTNHSSGFLNNAGQQGL